MAWAVRNSYRGSHPESAFAQVNVRIARLSGHSSCPRGVNLFGMWRVQRLDQINAFKPANLFDFKSLTLKFRREQIDRFKIVIRPRSKSVTAGEPLRCHPVRKRI